VSGLSVTCLTGDRPAGVAHALSLLRDLAAEIIVAVDSRVDPDLLGPLDAVADRVIRFEYEGPPETTRSWLAGQCSQPWMLHVDGDEVVSAALVGAIAEVVHRDDVVEARIARRWLYPDVSGWLAEQPWYPDFQVRLVRRTADLLVHPNLHGGFGPREPACYLLEPLYHLPTASLSVGERRRRAAAYAQFEDPVLAEDHVLAYGGGPLNSVFYLPELHASRRLAVTPEDDRTLLESVLDAGQEPVSSATHTQVATERPIVPRVEVLSWVGGFPREASAYDARVELLEPDLRFAPAERRPVTARVTNLSTFEFPFGNRAPEIRISHHVLAPDGERLLEGPRSVFPRSLRSGESCVVHADVQAPAVPGRYVLEIGLVHEHVRWFGTNAIADIIVCDRWERFSLEGESADGRCVSQSVDAWEGSA
jgi:hypothetical protein